MATDAQMAELEPTPSEIAIAKQMGNWDDAKPEESRMALMRVRARQRGIILPEEKK